MNTLKICKKCQVSKPLDAFNKDSGRPDGLHPYCRVCRKEQQKIWRDRPEIREHLASYAKAYYSQPEKRRHHSQTMKAYFLRNRHAYAARGQKWLADPANAAKVVAYRRQPRVKAAMKASSARWAKANPDARRAQFYRRLALKKGSNGSYTAADVALLWQRQRGRCANCRKSIRRKYHLDHMMPLSKGGANAPWNIQLLCPTCNLRKGAKLPERWAAENGRLL